MDDLVAGEVFWGLAVHQGAVERTERAIRAELTREEQDRDGGDGLCLVAAREAGPRSAAWARAGDEVYRRALEYLSGSGVTGVARELVAARVVDEFLGLGPLQPLLESAPVTEVMVNGPTTVFFEVHGRVRPLPAARFRDGEHLRQVVDRFLLAMNKTLTPKSPMIDGQLVDGSRINVTHERVSGSLTLTLRRFPLKTWTLIDLVDRGALSMDAAVDLAALVRARASVLVSGGTGSGKTTLLNAASGCASVDDRIVVIEDSRELRLHPDAANVVYLQSQPGGRDLHPVTMQELVKNALRMRPDRIIVGEVRDGVIVDMLQAASTGHDGSMSTIHANSVEETIARIVMLMARSGVEMTDPRMMDAIGMAIDVIVSVQRQPDGSRVVTQIAELVYDPVEHTIGFNPLWEWEPGSGHRRVGRPGADLQARLDARVPDGFGPSDLHQIAVAAATADQARLALLNGSVA